MYTFTAEPHITFSYDGMTFFGNEDYTFQTEDFISYLVKDQNADINSDVFSITADQSFDAEVMDYILVKQADYDCVAAMVQHFANHDLSICSEAYGDIAVEHGIFQRVLCGEETLQFLEEAEVVVDIDGVQLEYGKNKLIDENDKMFSYQVIYDADTENLNALRIYQYDQTPADISETQLEVLYDKAKSLYQAFEKNELKKSGSKDWVMEI